MPFRTSQGKDCSLSRKYGRVQATLVHGHVSIAAAGPAVPRFLLFLDCFVGARLITAASCARVQGKGGGGGSGAPRGPTPGRRARSGELASGLASAAAGGRRASWDPCSTRQSATGFVVRCMNHAGCPLSTVESTRRRAPHKRRLVRLLGLKCIRRAAHTARSTTAITL